MKRLGITLEQRELIEEACFKYLWPSYRQRYIQYDPEWVRAYDLGLKRIDLNNDIILLDSSGSSNQVFRVQLNMRNEMNTKEAI